MDDGSADRSGFIFYTNNFKLSEVENLVKVLKQKLNLNCTIQSRISKILNKPQYLIYIRSNSVNTFLDLVKPFIIPSMEYKLKLRKSFK
jgi:hypothetical protein